MPPRIIDPRLVGGDWVNQDPYKLPTQEPAFNPVYTGRCLCGDIEFKISRQVPLDAKFCHCRLCQKQHGAPFQWLAYFRKEDIRFTIGQTGLMFYGDMTEEGDRIFPWKISCAQCATPIMDERETMVYMYPTLINFRRAGESDNFLPSCHMYYDQGVISLIDTLPKCPGLCEMRDHSIPHTNGNR